MKNDYDKFDHEDPRSHGVQISSKNMDHNKKLEPILSEHWSRFFITEFVGTFIAQLMTCGVFFYLSGVGTHEQAVLNLELSGLLFLSTGISLAYFLGILIGRDANLNCAFTFAMAIVGIKKWKLVPLIILAQFIGGISADLLFYYLINGKQYKKDIALAAVFGNVYPSSNIYNNQCFLSSVCFTALLIIGLLPIFAPELGGHHMKYTTSCMIVALIIFSCIITSIELGAQNNPTLWFSGYGCMLILGFPKEIFTQHNHYWWVALSAPFVGVIVSVIFLIFFPIIIWNEPNMWRKALKKALEKKNE